MRFQWDSAKAASNLKRYGVSFDEASTVFADDFSATARDLKNSIGEVRYVIFGRAATRRERRIYEAG